MATINEPGDHGRLITFYSYKGGTGRTMALANIACLLARSHQAAKSGEVKKPVLTIDWDLEAPGLYRYFAPLLNPQAREGRCPGVIELFGDLASSIESGEKNGKSGSADAVADELVDRLDLTAYVTPTSEPGLSFMPAGRLDADYPARITSFDWGQLMSRVPTLMTAFAGRLASEFSYVLIDSRTGLNDTSGICTALLPDMLVTVFTPNLQSLLGLTSVIEDVVTFRRESPDTRRLTILPLASRVETARPALLEQWRTGNGTGFRGYQREFESVLGKLYGLDHCDLSKYFEEVQTQHVPDYAYGEEIAAISEAATDNRLSLKRSYENFMTWLVADTPPWIHPSIVSAAAEVRELCERASRALDDGQLDSARRVLYLALDQPEAARASGGAELAAVLSGLAAALADADRLADAEQAMGDAADVAEFALGADDPMTAVYLERQAELLDRLGRPADARRLLWKVVTRRREMFGTGHIAVAEAYEKLGRVLGELDDITGSSESLTKGLEIRRALFGTDQPFRAGSVDGLAKAYGQIAAAQRQHGNTAAAEEWYQLCVAVCEKEDDKDGLADAYLQLSDLARERGDYDANGRWNQLRLSIVRKQKSAPTTPSQAVLRITIAPAPTAADGPAQRQFEVSWHDGSTPWVAASLLGYQMNETDAERIRWYLEDYPEYPADPGRDRALAAEAVLAKAGTDLFRGVFGRADAAQIWERARDRLGQVRVEIATGPGEETELPWELLRDPDRDTAVAVHAKAFVRTRIPAAASATLPPAAGDRLRVLLVISRPGNHDDVPFRSVGRYLVRGRASQMTGLDLDVLRPATFERLSQALRAAYDAGQPYHVVHFDGHGAYLDLAGRQAEGSGGRIRAKAATSGSEGPAAQRDIAVAGTIRAGRRGYLIFEDPDTPAGQRLADGPSLGRLLADTGAPVLVLNACESAHAEAFGDHVPLDPPTKRSGGGPAHSDLPAGPPVRAYESLAAEITHAGVPGVVTMRYNLYAVTVAQFIADLYAHLLAGRSLGEAATAARRALAADPMRQIGPVPVPLQDWAVPAVYEAAPLVLLRPEERAAPLIRIDPAEALAGQAAVGPRLSDVGFFGRDETLLTLDRAFETHQVVLLHSFAGSGKSATAAEFARWYQATGGLDVASTPEWKGAVLWSSFEHHLTADRVIGTAGDYFAPSLEASGVTWAAVVDPVQRRDIMMQVLAQVPVLWVWDNVEPVTGFPAGTLSDWTPAEQAELADLLRELTQRTKCKVLLTSRRDEHGWLGDLPARVVLPPLPMRESLQLATALAAQHGRGGLADLDWRPLLRYAAGNPLTITVLVSQALRENLASDQAIEDFAARLRSDEAQLEPGEDIALGRARSQAASLSYGLTQGFTDGERAQIAVLHLFRDTVLVETFQLMGDPEAAGEDAVAQLAGLDRDICTALLDRVADIGMLTRLDGRYYRLHPALPWYFTALFTATYGQPDGPVAEHATRAYAKVIGILGAYIHDQFESSPGGALPILQAEEGNLRHALDSARAAGLWHAAGGCLQGLSMLYEWTGRDGEWARLIAEVTPDFTDPTSEGPLPGREEQWRIVSGYRVRLATQARDWPTATALQDAVVALNRTRAAAALAAPTSSLTAQQRDQIGDLAGSLYELGTILGKVEEPSCLAAFEETLGLTQRIGDRYAEALAANALGRVFLTVPTLRDLDRAERSFQHALSLRAEDEDRIGRAQNLRALGAVASERFYDARAAGEAEPVLLEHLNAAVRNYQQALDLTPQDDLLMRGDIERQLGGIYRQAGDTGLALRHYQDALRFSEARGDIYSAGQTRYSIAALLAGDERTSDAIQYARAALENFQEAGPGAADEVARTRHLITGLEKGT